MKKKKCKKRVKFRRRGIIISPTFHWIRLILFSLLLVFISWYAKQKYTNPFDYHDIVSIHKIGKSYTLNIYKENFRNRLDTITIDIDSQNNYNLTKPTLVSDTTNDLILGNHIVLDSSYFFIKNKTYSLLFLKLDNIIPKIVDKIDILIIPKELLNNINLVRKRFQPKLSIILGSGNTQLPNNCYFINDSNNYLIENENYGNLTMIKDK